MSAFAAIKKAEEFGKNYQQKFDMLSRSHMKGEYNDTPSMESGRYNSAGMRSDGRRRIQGYSTGQRYKAMADREASYAKDMQDLKRKKRLAMKQEERPEETKRDENGFPVSAYT
jgi:hypothetical protein